MQKPWLCKTRLHRASRWSARPPTSRWSRVPHQGRTGPCCDALLHAGIARVVACGTDPNPLVAGQGFARLRAAGVAVEVLPQEDPLAKAARALNIGFSGRMLRQSSWVRMKVAASLDGTTALPNGHSQWITSTEARTDGHAWRALPARY